MHRNCPSAATNCPSTPNPGTSQSVLRVSSHHPEKARDPSAPSYQTAEMPPTAGPCRSFAPTKGSGISSNGYPRVMVDGDLVQSVLNFVYHAGTSTAD